MDYYNYNGMKIPIIDDDTSNDFVMPTIDGVEMGRGYVPRDLEKEPIEVEASPSNLQLIPRSEWSDRIKEKTDTLSRLSDIVKKYIPDVLNQGQDGYCWTYSTGFAIMVIRAINNQPYIKLNPHSIGAIVKNGANQGGWCGQSLKFARENGIAPSSIWPDRSRSLSHNTQSNRQEMLKYKVSEDYYDIAKQIHNQYMTLDQQYTCLLSNIPCPSDYMWWLHSVCALDVVEVERNSFGTLIMNSWGESWGERGLGILRGSRAIPDGCVGVRVIKAAA